MSQLCARNNHNHSDFLDFEEQFFRERPSLNEYGVQTDSECDDEVVVDDDASSYSVNSSEFSSSSANQNDAIVLQPQTGMFTEHSRSASSASMHSMSRSFSKFTKKFQTLHRKASGLSTHSRDISCNSFASDCLPARIPRNRSITFTTRFTEPNSPSIYSSRPQRSNSRDCKSIKSQSVSPTVSSPASATCEHHHVTTPDTHCDVLDQYFLKMRGNNYQHYHAANSMTSGSDSCRPPEDASSIEAPWLDKVKSHSEGWTVKNGVLVDRNETQEEEKENIPVGKSYTDEYDIQAKTREARRRQDMIASLIADDVLRQMDYDVDYN